MPKERAQQQAGGGRSSPPFNASNHSPVNEKSLQQVQRVHKKFSLASAFPLSSPNRAHHYRQQPQAPRANAATQEPDHRIRSAPVTIKGAAGSNREARLELRQGSAAHTRKHSAPVDYRDSGVYLGEIGHDPVLDMSNSARDTYESPILNRVGADELDEPDLPASAPVSLKAQAKRRFRRNVQTNVPSVIHTSESSKSLPAIDISHLPTDHHPELQRSITCGASSSDKPFRVGEEEPADQALSQFANWDLEDHLLPLDSDRPTARAARLKPQRNAQSFSNENLVDRNELLSCEPSDRGRKAEARTNVRFDESEEVSTKQLLVKKRSSIYRRSRSLAEDEKSRIELEEEIQQELEEAEKEVERDTGGGRLSLLRKSGQTTMVQVHAETDSGACKGAKKKKSLADPIAKKLTLTFLRRRPTGSSLAPSAGAAVGGGAMNATNSSSSSHQSAPKPPSRDDVRKWAVSFEHLLGHRYGVMLFRLFLQREFSEENIDFWTACEEYKKMRDTKLATQARQIYNDFVAVQAPKEVNLDSVTRSITMTALNNPNKRTFEQAQHRIQSLMEKDSYPRFLRSDLYLDLVRKY